MGRGSRSTGAGAGTGGVGWRTSIGRALMGDFTGDASTAGRGVRSRAGASAFRGGSGLRSPPPPPPPPGPGVSRNTSRGAGFSAGALSGAPVVSHSIVTTNAPWTSEDANEGRPLRRTANGFRSAGCEDVCVRVADRGDPRCDHTSGFDTGANRLAGFEEGRTGERPSRPALDRPHQRLRAGPPQLVRSRRP